MRANGEQPPDHHLPPPRGLNPEAEDFYLDAFFHLSTERAIGMGIGPIPHHRVVEYARDVGLDDVARGVFVTVIRTLDRAYLAEEAAAARAQEQAP